MPPPNRVDIYARILAKKVLKEQQNNEQKEIEQEYKDSIINGPIISLPN